VEQGISEVIEGALAAVAPITFAPRSIVVHSPWVDVLALAPRTLEGTIFPPQRMDIDVAAIGVEEVVDVCKHWHG